MINDKTSLDEAIELLRNDKIALPDESMARLNRYIDLVREWRAFASLVSESDSSVLMEAHVVDSLSLASIVKRCCGRDGHYLDIGSGGGFPAIPIKIALPELHVTLVERSGRKVGFLQKAVGALGLSQVTVHCGDFPRLRVDCVPEAITARAVEKPKEVIKSILASMASESTFLCQSVLPEEDLGGMFHVEQVQDIWNDLGLRRGELHLITKKGPQPS